MPFAYCPSCDDHISLRNPRIGQKLFCPHCDIEVEIIGIDPLHLDWAYDSSYDEDWAEEEDDD